MYICEAVYPVVSHFIGTLQHLYVNKSYVNKIGSCIWVFFAPIAQSVERDPVKVDVVGSSPAGSV